MRKYRINTVDIEYDYAEFGRRVDDLGIDTPGYFEDITDMDELPEVFKIAQLGMVGIGIYDDWGGWDIGEFLQTLDLTKPHNVMDHVWVGKGMPQEVSWTPEDGMIYGKHRLTIRDYVDRMQELFELDLCFHFNDLDELCYPKFTPAERELLKSIVKPHILRNITDKFNSLDEFERSVDALTRIRFRYAGEIYRLYPRGDDNWVLATKNYISITKNNKPAKLLEAFQIEGRSLKDIWDQLDVIYA